MKINYTYTEYKDFPKATEVSKTRERNGALLSMIAVLWSLFSVIFLIANLSEWLECLIPIVVSMAMLYYSFKIYPRATKMKVQKAIDESIAKKQHIAKIVASGPAGVSFIDYRDSTLIVVFKNGLEYRHYDVPRYIYEGLRTAPSKEDYYNSHIKSKYPRW